MKYLTESDLIFINQEVLKKAKTEFNGIQYPQGLDIIITQPQQFVFGHELYPGLFLKAAFILQKITKKHIFVDGNKRTALLAADIFLQLNGYQLDYDLKDGISMILYITTNNDSEEIMLWLSNWLKGHAVQIKKRHS